MTNNASLWGTSITLGNQAGDVMNFGTLTFNSTGGVSIAEDSATVLVGISTADSLVLSSTASITNAANASLTVTNNASFSSPSIDLGNQIGDVMNFGTLTFNSAGLVSIAEDSATLLFGTSTADSLVLTSVASITNTASASLTVTNNASLWGTSITLGNQAGDTMNFGTLTFNSTGGVSIAEDSATLLFGTSTADSLVLTSIASITNTASASLTVTNNASFSAPSIDLGNQIGDVMNFGTLTFNSAGFVSIAEDSATVLAGTSTADSLVLTSTASITNAANASLTVTNFASLSGTSITLGNQAGDTMNFGTLRFNSAGFVSIAEDSAMVLAPGTSTADSLVLSSTASITNAGTPSTSLTVTNNASFSGTSITLGNQTGDTMNFGTLTFNSTGGVSIAEDSATVLGGTSTAGSLVLSSTASITNAPNTGLAVTNNASFSGSSIDLGNQTGDTMNFGTLTFNSAGLVSIAEDSATVLAGISTADGLVLSSTASIANAASASLTVTHNASFSGTSITLGNQAGDTMNFGTLTFNSTGGVSIAEDSATLLFGTSTADSLVLTSVASITNTASASLTVTNNASFSAPSIDLGNQIGDVMNFDTVTFNSAGPVSIAVDSATALAGTSTADKLGLSSTASITNAANASLTVTNNASFSGTSITLGNQAGDTMNFGSLTFNSAGFVSIAEDSAMALAGTSTADSLVLGSTTSITNAASTSLTATNNASFSAPSIDLGNQTADTMNFGTLTFNSTGPVSIAEDSATVLGGTSTADSLVLSSTASITDAAGASLTVTNNASFSAPSIDLGNRTADTMNFGTLTFNATGPVSIAEDSATVLAGISTADGLVLSSTASITNAGTPSASLTVTNNASFSLPSIDLGNQIGDVMNFGTLTFNSAGLVSIAEDSATLLFGTSTADSLVLSSTASITNAPNTSLTVTNNASLWGTSITLGDQAGDTMNFGTLTFNSTGGVSIAEDSATVLAGASTADSLVLTSTGSINPGTGESVTAGVIHLTAVSGIGNLTTLEISGASISADTINGDINLANQATAWVVVSSLTTGVGNITFAQTGPQTLQVTLAQTVDGSIAINNAGADLMAVTVTANGTARDVGLTTTVSGSVLVGSVTATRQVTITAAAAINEYGSDAAADVTAPTIDLNAVTGIGNLATLETSGLFVSADTTNGKIDLLNLATAPVTVSSLTTGAGDIQLRRRAASC